MEHTTDIKTNTQLLSEHIRSHAAQSANESELRIRVETLLEPIRKKWGIQWASYEHRHHISGTRKDALYGTVIIEYKSPGKLDSKNEFVKAKEQVKRYIQEEEGSPSKYFGVILDGYKISFVRYRKNKWDEQEEPLPVNAQTVLRLLEAIRGLRRKPIDAELLLIDFGPKSSISRKAIVVLYEALIESKSPRTRMLFNDWKRVFSQVCAYSKEKLTGLINYYGLTKEKNVDVEKLLYAIHTYYTLLMKLLTSEIVTLFADSLLGSYLKRLEEAYYRSRLEMLGELVELEEGGIFLTIGIRNFLEADYFAWYLDEWNEEIADQIFEMVKKLLDYEPATVELNPERVKDLFKRLYQNLVPRTIRHKIGEYFTPDWLAELLLDEVEYDGNPEKRILDPACGSGTFLVLAIRRIRDYAEEHFIDSRELVRKIIENVRGIDLNPLAVLASKANYLIALSDLIRYRPREGIEIPIYLADSISVERTITLHGEAEFTLHTTEGKFWVTKEVIDKNLLYQVLSLMTKSVKIGQSMKEFGTYLATKVQLSKQSIKSLMRLYDKILKLQRMGKNEIWASLLKNSFSPMLIGKFDYVVGNPPWVNWENLPEFYRESTKHLWADYGLLERTKGMGLGKTKRDISMLFVTRCFANYMKDSGKLAFLIPFTVYKTQTGAGFRRYLVNKCKVKIVHDLVELYPFEGAINRTSLLVIENGKSKVPLPCRMWVNPKSKGIEQEAELEEVKELTKQFDMILAPVKKGKPETSWMIITKKSYDAVQKAMRSSEYNAYAGVYTGLNGAYWVEIISKAQDGFLVRNAIYSGLKKKMKQIPPTVIEADLIFPLIRGQDHSTWYAIPSGYIIAPVNEKGATMSHSEMRTKFPKTYGYFLKFFNDLVNRGGEPFKSKLEPYRKLPFNKAEKTSPPFYWLFNVKQTLAQYKVVWKYISGKISGKGEFSVAVMGPMHNEILGEKIVIPDHRLMVIPFENREEAHYVAAVLNSSIARLIVMSYTIETAISTHVIKNVYVPKFSSKKPLHKKLSKFSIKAHKLARQIHGEKKQEKKEELAQIEREIDKNVGRLYGITDTQMNEIRKTLRLLRKGTTEQED